MHEFVNSLQKENQRLKDLLRQAGIDYSACLEEDTEALLSNGQTKRIHSFAITEDTARYFFARFWDREDVYAKRNASKKTEKVGHFPQCDNL